MNKRRILFEIIQDFFMCIVITATVSFVNKADIFSLQFIYDFLLAYVINLLIGFILPEIPFARIITKRISDENVVKNDVLIPGIIAIINVSIILTGVLLTKFSFSKLCFKVWLSLYPTLIVVGVIAACILFKVTNKLVDVILK